MEKYSDIKLNEYMAKYGPYFLNINDINHYELELVKYFNLRLVDRTGVLNHKGDYTIVSALPDGLTNKSFSDICSERAESIKNTPNELVLLWSGGLDSTAVFYALKNANTQFKVLFNDNSIEEFPELGQQLLNNTFDNVESMYRVSKEFSLLDYVVDNPDTKFITGEIGDQTFGTVIAYDMSYEDRQKHYQDVLPENIWQMLNIVVDRVLPKGLEKTNTAEYLWACNFLLKYQNVLVRMAYQYQIAPVEPFNNAIHFFDTDDFQRWSMQSYEENASYKTAQTYKQKMRDYLVEQGCPKSYTDNKIKIGSLREALYDAGKPKFNRQQIIG